MARILFRFLMMAILVCGEAAPARAQDAHAPTMSPVPDSQNLVSDLGYRKPGNDSETLRLLDKQNHQLETRENGIFGYQKNQESGSGQAQKMVKLIQDQEFQAAMGRLTRKGNTILEENPGLKSPLSVLAGAAALWFGRTINLIQSDGLTLTSRIEARNQSGEFTLQSPLLNSSLQYHSDTGMGLNINRKISSIDTSAQINYNMKNQTVGTQINHQLAPHLDFTFGVSQNPQSSQPDNRAGLQYQINF